MLMKLTMLVDVISYCKWLTIGLPQSLGERAWDKVLLEYLTRGSHYSRATKLSTVTYQ